MRVLFHACTYFHACTSTRVFTSTRVYHDTCAFHAISNHGPRRHVTGMQVSVLVISRVITRVIVKL